MSGGRDAVCIACGANWSAGAFSDDCDVCGGGAMERGCTWCDGRCGARFTRAVLDSNDYKLAHWIGGCGLPMDERLAIMKKLAEDMDRKGRS